MAENIYLVGSDTVASAARQMSSAAEDMRRAAANFDDALNRHRQWMDDWLQRFESTIESLKVKSDG